MPKLPYIQFFMRDWLADVALNGCSLASRQVWFTMIGLMHDAEPFGHLLINGKPPAHERLAQITHCTPREIGSSIEELEQAHVFSRTSEGIIYCRRMVRNAAKKARQREQLEAQRDAQLGLFAAGAELIDAGARDAMKRAKGAERSRRYRERKRRRESDATQEFVTQHDGAAQRSVACDVARDGCLRFVERDGALGIADKSGVATNGVTNESAHPIPIPILESDIEARPLSARNEECAHERKRPSPAAPDTTKLASFDAQLEEMRRLVAKEGEIDGAPASSRQSMHAGPDTPDPGSSTKSAGLCI